MVASAIRLVFEQPDERAARSQVDAVLEGLRPRFASVAVLLADAEPDLLAHFSFPDTHPRQDPQHEPARAAQQGGPSAGATSSASSPTGLGHPARRG
jgi:hypothetical protein